MSTHQKDVYMSIKVHIKSIKFNQTKLVDGSLVSVWWSTAYIPLPTLTSSKLHPLAKNMAALGTGRFLPSS